jgi:hypothetical protein
MPVGDSLTTHCDSLNKALKYLQLDQQRQVAERNYNRRNEMKQPKHEGSARRRGCNHLSILP